MPVYVSTVDVQYQPSHLNASMGETMVADGKPLLERDCKFSRTVLPVGPLHAETEQLIDITGDKMLLVADHRDSWSRTTSSSSSATSSKNGSTIWISRRFPSPSRIACRGVMATGHHFTWPLGAAFHLREFKVKRGDEFDHHLTNLDKVEDRPRLRDSKHNVNFIVNPQETSRSRLLPRKRVFLVLLHRTSVTLHLEMRSRMLVEARQRPGPVCAIICRAT